MAVGKGWGREECVKEGGAGKRTEDKSKSRKRRFEKFRRPLGRLPEGPGAAGVCRRPNDASASFSSLRLTIPHSTFSLTTILLSISISPAPAHVKPRYATLKTVLQDDVATSLGGTSFPSILHIPRLRAHNVTRPYRPWNLIVRTPIPPRCRASPYVDGCAPLHQRPTRANNVPSPAVLDLRCRRDRLMPAVVCTQKRAHPSRPPGRRCRPHATSLSAIAGDSGRYWHATR
ncbi:hypothetical protein EIP91_003890 [Steccherinum ochraceum]|uniref:Uncharacterized protein n=1 Tax=Steccherinum ochraceum TaxID=92696 RepID=A0A4R0RQC1_9APHY|nr:hypothetical protein EIP91_003890 [Steccherinum ochraceum]